MRINIYQMLAGKPGRFFSSEHAVVDGMVPRASYKQVYGCVRDDDTNLEDIFCEFNENRPDDFRGHSLSVSDVVEVDNRLYFVDSVGFKKVEWK